MSIDTEHVRNLGDGLEMVAGIPTFTELLANPALASLYTSIRHSTTTTGPELIEAVDVSKKTVYEYLHKLEQAGLISETGTDGGTSVYEAADFELSVTVREVEVSITPELVGVVAYADEYPVIEMGATESTITRSVAPAGSPFRPMSDEAESLGRCPRCGADIHRSQILITYEKTDGSRARYADCVSCGGVVHPV